MKQRNSTALITVAFSLLLWVPISESEAASIISHRRFREQRDAGIVQHPVGAVSGFGKAPDSDIILQSSPGLGRSIGDDYEHRNIQPRRVSGFAVFNFAADPNSGFVPASAEALAGVAATTVGPETTVQDPFSLSSSVTFANLVERARQRGGNPSTPSLAPAPTSTSTTTTPATTTETTQSTTSQATAQRSNINDSTSSRSNSRYRGQQQPIVRSKKRPQLTYQQLQKFQKTSNRFIRRQQRVRTTASTTTTAETTTSTTTTAETTTPAPTTFETTTTAQPSPTTLSTPLIYTNFETASAFVVTRNVTSTNVVTERQINFDETTNTDESIFTTPAPTRKQRQNDELSSPTYDYYYSETTPTYYDYDESDTTNGPTVPMPPSTTVSPIEEFLRTTTTTTTTTTATTTTTTTTTSTTTTPTTTTTTEAPISVEETTVPATTSAARHHQDTTKAETESETTFESSSTPTLETSDRSPRTSDVDKWDKNEEQHLDEDGPTGIFSGKYFEINPGQYFENNPGQYNEDNPGQYHEQNPGQYYDPHLAHGQYNEVNPGQYRGDHLDVQVVEHKYTDDAQVYNVQSKVDNFIIGEYGTISKSDGQTIQGVRYTAVDESIDPKIIYDTLRKFFPMAAQQQQEEEDQFGSEDEEEEER